MLQASKVEKNKTHKLNDKLHKTFYFYFVNKSKKHMRSIIKYVHNYPCK
jgi:hypothetical protein